jgi:hypothetical protein
MIWWPINTSSWMAAAFVVAFALAVIVFAILGVGNRGTMLALRVTARWSFLLFWLPYAGGALARRCGPRLSGLGRYGRELGLAFASAQLVHVGLVLWAFHIATEPSGAMVFFWIGIVCTYLLALFSLPRLRDALGPRLWRAFCTIALEYIALVFAADFILLPLWAGGFGKYPLTYLPFAVMLVTGAGLRAAAFTDRKPARPPLEVAGPPKVSQFDRISQKDYSVEINREGKDRLIVWPVVIFVGVILILLASDNALWMLFWTALGLYGPIMLAFVAYFLLKLAVSGVNFIGSQFNY